ncbi:MAG: helix-turn-helix domain-containing protein [Lachnospiraceae bacterium]|nr:helix-turn-helix domain-containing protein [Lachnospiraceae bacterium]
MGDINYRDIGERIDELRIERGYSMEELAEALDISRQTLSKWLNQDIALKLENAVKVCDVLGCDMDYLLFGKDSNGYKDKEKQIAGELLGLSPEAITSLIKIRDGVHYETRLGFGKIPVEIPKHNHNKSLINYIFTYHNDVVIKFLDSVEELNFLLAKLTTLSDYVDIMQETDMVVDNMSERFISEYNGKLFELQRYLSDFIEKIDFSNFNKFKIVDKTKE